MDFFFKIDFFQKLVSGILQECRTVLDPNQTQRCVVPGSGYKLLAKIITRRHEYVKLTLCMIGNFFMFLSSVDFFSNIEFFEKLFSGILSDCQTVWIQVRPAFRRAWIWVQTVCKSYHQTTLVGQVSTLHDGYFFVFLSSVDFFFKIDFFQKLVSGILQECRTVLDPDQTQRCVVPGSGYKLFAKIITRRHEYVKLTLCMIGNFLCFCRLWIFFQNRIFRKTFFRNTIRLSKNSDPGQTQRFVVPGSGYKLFAKVITRRH